jgi:hypothetical protein
VTKRIRPSLSGRPKGDPRCAARWPAVALAAAVASLLLAQGQVGSGHSLDGSLQVGSYGYNGYTGSSAPIQARNYAPYRGSSRQYLYSGEAPSAIQNRATNITPFDTYLTDRQYQPAWSSGTNAYSAAGAGGGSSLRIDYRVGG